MKDIVLAPVKGITDLIYRETYNKVFGDIDWAIAPFFNLAEGSKIKDSQLQEVDTVLNSIKTTPQFIGNNPNHLQDVCRQLSEKGIDKININLGCPQPTMTKKSKGSGLLDSPQKIEKLISTIASDTNIEISVKLRLGLDSEDDLKDLIPILNKYKLGSVTIHARTAKQLYSGKVNLDKFEEYASQLNSDVLYNGDITSKEDFEYIAERFPFISGIMIGRGIFQTPALPSLIRNKDCSKIKEQLKAFSYLLEQGYKERLSGEAHQLAKLKSHWEYLASSFENSNRTLRKIKKSKTMAEINSHINSLFDLEIAKPKSSLI